MMEDEVVLHGFTRSILQNVLMLLKNSTNDDGLEDSSSRLLR